MISKLKFFFLFIEPDVGMGQPNAKKLFNQLINGVVCFKKN